MGTHTTATCFAHRYESAAYESLGPLAVLCQPPGSQGQGSHTTSKFDLRRASSGLNLNPPEVESKEKVCWIFDILQICRNHGHSVENIMNRHHLIEIFGAVRFGWRLPLLLSFIALALAGREMSIGSVLIFRPQLQSASDSTQLHQIAHLGTACGRLL
jgi:hypothetical protein